MVYGLGFMAQGLVLRVSTVSRVLFRGAKEDEVSLVGHGIWVPDVSLFRLFPWKAFWLPPSFCLRQTWVESV